VFRLPLEAEQVVLLLGCDGIFDRLSNEAVAK
jgi:hypothetical protein